MDYIDFLKTSKYYNFNDNYHYFQGNFDIEHKVCSTIYSHFLDTKVNLLNEYVEVVYLSWMEHEKAYFTLKDFNENDQKISNIRRLKIPTLFSIIHEAMYVNRSGYKNFLAHQKKKSNQPRIDAQKFISKTKIRCFIFRRDKKCLSCGVSENLTLDHIVPVSKGGSNTLFNLQALCKSCNSKKSDTYKDFR